MSILAEIEFMPKDLPEGFWHSSRCLAQIIFLRLRKLRCDDVQPS